MLRAKDVIRPHTDTTVQGLIGRIKRRQLLRLGFLGGTLLAITEITVLVSVPAKSVTWAPVWFVTGTISAQYTMRRE